MSNVVNIRCIHFVHVFKKSAYWTIISYIADIMASIIDYQKNSISSPLLDTLTSPLPPRPILSILNLARILHCQMFPKKIWFYSTLNGGVGVPTDFVLFYIILSTPQEKANRSKHCIYIGIITQISWFSICLSAKLCVINLYQTCQNIDKDGRHFILQRYKACTNSLNALTNLINKIIQIIQILINKTKPQTPTLNCHHLLCTDLI